MASIPSLTGRPASARQDGGGAAERAAGERPYMLPAGPSRTSRAVDEGGALGPVAGVGVQAGRFLGGGDGQSGAHQRVAIGDVWGNVAPGSKRESLAENHQTHFYVFCGDGAGIQVFFPRIDCILFYNWLV